MQPKYPTVGFFPALPLGRNLECGAWVVGIPPSDIPWRSERFKELVDKLLASFASDEFGDKFTGGALLWRKANGFDGTPPSREEFVAIQAAVRFAALDSNDHIKKDDPNRAYHLLTSENAALHVQPIEEDEGKITHFHEGFLKSGLHGGWKIGDRPPPLADATRPILGHVSMSSKLANAVFQAHLEQTTDELRRLCIAVEWHAVALSNAAAVTLQQRLIALKTGFEALLGSSNSRESARRLRALFENAAKQYHHLLPSSNVLWSPMEKTDLKRDYKKKPETRSELEDWFMTLADARNAIIHEGRVSITEYKAPPERPLSRYTGSLFWKGERVLREAVKASLGSEILLCGPLKRAALYAPLVELLEAQEREKTSAAAKTSSASSSKAISKAKRVQVRPDRNLGQLLHELGCRSANQVRIGRSLPQASHSEAAAMEMAAAVSWVAKAGSIELGISDTEREALEQAGAEEELPDYIILCD